MSMPVSSAACQSSAVARIALPQRQRESRSWSAPIRTSASVSVASRTSGIDSSPTVSTAPPYAGGMERSSAVLMPPRGGGRARGRGAGVGAPGVLGGRQACAAPLADDTPAPGEVAAVGQAQRRQRVLPGEGGGGAGGVGRGEGLEDRRAEPRGQ